MIRWDLHRLSRHRSKITSRFSHGSDSILAPEGPQSIAREGYFAPGSKIRNENPAPAGRLRSLPESV